MITKQEALALIRQVLPKSLWSKSAVTLVFCTGLKESGYRTDRQLGGGPALGYWQMEPATHDDIWKNYLAYRPALAAIVRHYGHTPVDLVKNPAYALLMCRIKYLRDNQALPAPFDAVGMAQTWKRVYNTHKGAGKLDSATLKLFEDGVNFVRNS